jgi:hypothetical protein
LLDAKRITAELTRSKPDDVLDACCVDEAGERPPPAQCRGATRPAWKSKACGAATDCSVLIRRLLERASRTIDWIIMYSTYLRRPDQQVSDKTRTARRDVAVEAFSALVNRADLDGGKMIVVLNCGGAPIACHHFDAAPDDSMHYWRGRLSNLVFPASPTLALNGTSARSDRISTRTDGGPLKRCATNLDETSIALLTALGDGDLSEGIRLAARRCLPSHGGHHYRFQLAHLHG